MATYRYSRWDGTQQIFQLDEDSLLESLFDDILAHGDVDRAVCNLLQRGWRGDDRRIEGLRDLLDRLRQQRQRQLERFNLDLVLDDLKERLQDVIDTERGGIDKRLEQARQRLERAENQSEELQGPMRVLEERARRGKETLDNLPPGTAGAIRELTDYDFIDTDARQKFQELLDSLNQRMLENFFQSMRQQLQGLRPEQVQGLNDMINALNQMLSERATGMDPDFEGFMEHYGHYFDPDQPSSLDDLLLLERIRGQMAAMQSLINSMRPGMRNEVESLLDSAMPPELMDGLAELAGRMHAIFPPDDIAGEYPFMGEESLTMDHALELMAHLQDLDEVERQLQRVARDGSLENIDLDKLEETLGEDARRQLEEFQRLIRRLEEAGYLRRRGDRLELTPRAVRRLAQQALNEVFSELKKDRAGRHEVHSRGEGGENTGETKVYEFGDPFDIDLHRTLFNSVLRQGPSVPVRVSPEDMEINRTEHLTQAATVLAAGPEPLDGDVQKLRIGQKGSTGALLAHQEPIPQRPLLPRGVLRLRHGD